MVCVVGRMRDLILQLSKSSIYSTKPAKTCRGALPRRESGLNAAAPAKLSRHASPCFTASGIFQGTDGYAAAGAKRTTLLPRLVRQCVPDP
ncbi:hypothetical protein EAO18_02605 [Klebsiella pneumoniae]|nr:hypothetical protein EAO18_02605 [Klebsiella pneumoniae]